jgi:hypothetical protein
MLTQLSMNTQDTYCSSSLCLVPPKDVNLRPGGTACCCVCHMSALVWSGGKYIPRSNSDCDNICKYYFTKVHAVQHPVASIKIQLSKSWQVSWDSDVAIYVFLPCGITIHAPYCMTCFAMTFTEQFRWQTSYCMTTLVHIWHIWLRQRWKRVGKLWTTCLMALI